MSKPLGVSLTVDAGRNPRMFVTPSDRVTDQIWDAVREAINANMTPKQFLSECEDAWQHHLKQDAEYASDVLRGKKC